MNLKRLSLIAGLANGLMLTAIVSLILACIFNNFYPQSSVGTDFAVLFVILFFASLISIQGGTLQVSFNNANARMVFENAREFLRNVGLERKGQLQRFEIDEAKATLFELRSEVALEVGKSNYNFPIVKNQNDSTQNRVLNNLINLQDILIGCLFSYTITIGTSTDASAKTYTYPNQVAFSTSGAANALWALYNGTFSLLNNNVQVVPSFPALRSMFVPQTQAITAYQYSGSTATATDQVDFSDNTWNALEPNWVIDGGGNMQLNHNCKGGPAVIQTNSTGCVRIYGLLLQNVTNIVA